MHVPCGEYLLRPHGVLRVPHERTPIGIHDEGAPAGLEHAEKLRQGDRHIGDVLIDLRDDGRIEVIIRKRQAQRVGLPERHVRLRFAPRLGDGEHGRAFVHADNNSSFPHYPVRLPAS